METNGVVARALLERAGIGIERFAELAGVKPGSVRAAFSSGRISKSMREVLHDLGNAEQIKEFVGKDEEPEELGDESLARVYCLPRNRYLYLVEFPDGSHGKFRSKPGRFHLGSEVRLKRGAGDLWELAGEYDRRGRLL